MKRCLIPLVIVALLLPFMSKLDLAISSYFYTRETGLFFNNGVTAFFYKYGEICGFIVGGGAGALYFLSFFMPRWRKARAGALVLLLTWCLGAGLIINVGLKDHWGRPRPKQVVEFGGKHEFRPFYSPNFHTKNDPQKSFPSGHVATGFYYLCFCLVGMRYQNRFLVYLGIALTVVLGLGLFLTRIAQGGHFFSDALFAALIMWMVALLADFWVFEKNVTSKYRRFLS